MIQIVKKKCCGVVFAACVEPDCHVDEDWIRNLKDYQNRGDKVEMVENGTLPPLVKCQCRETITNYKKQMSTEEKARELVDKFKNYVSGYVGSSMLVNYEYPEQILSQAKKVAIITVDEILKQFDGLDKPEYCAFDAIGERKFAFDGEYPDHMTGYDMIAYWEDVKVKIEELS